MPSLILKRASPSRQSGEWNDDDFDVLADGVVVGRIFHAAASPVDVDPSVWAPRRPHTDPRLRGDARGRDGGICKELAAGMTKKRRVYQPRVFDGRVIMSDEIERIHKEVLKFEPIDPSPIPCAS
jgi:hypothetical protein